MGHYAIKVDLKKLEGAFTGSIKGVNCVIIPVDANHIFCSDKGSAYLDMVGIELKQEGKFGGTHLVKRSLTKMERDSLNGQNDNLPILGDMKPLGGTAKGSVQNTPAVEVDATDLGTELEDDMPF